MMGMGRMIIVALLAVTASLGAHAQQLKVAVTSAAENAPFFAAVERGLFSKAGLDVKVEVMPSGVEISNALASNTVDVGLFGTFPFLTAVARGVPVVLIGHTWNNALNNPQSEILGVVCLLNATSEVALPRHLVSFVEALAGTAVIAIENQILLREQKALLDSLIKLIAGAIDAKSPYTGGHCQRVPEIATMLARAACDAKDGAFRDFTMNDEEWETLHIAAWLHDCGKVTTPEYVVDKATKLQTIYDRLHEVRMRFEVLKRDAEVEYWKRIADGGDRTALRAELDAKALEAEHPVHILQLVGDSLPGIGIVAAVLGIINTMASISEGPEKVGEKVAAALTGTLLGIFVAYGFVSPLATRVKFNNASDDQFLKCIMQAVSGFAKGLAPLTAVEIARRSLDSSVQPDGATLETQLKALNTK